MSDIPLLLLGIKIEQLTDVMAQRNRRIEQAADLIIEADVIMADLRRRLDLAESALAERDKPCWWMKTDFGFESSCHYLTTYTADEFLFCPGCGHPVDVP